MVKNFDHDHGQNFKIALVKWSKLVIYDHDHSHDHGQNFKIALVEWSKLVDSDHRPWSNSRVSWSWSIFFTIDHGVNSRVSWSWSQSVPYPSPNLKCHVNVLLKAGCSINTQRLIKIQIKVGVKQQKRGCMLKCMDLSLLHKRSQLSALEKPHSTAQ